MYLDAKGKACPMPVILAKQELDKGCEILTIAVDNKIAVENLCRLGASRGLAVGIAEDNGVFEVSLISDGTKETFYAKATDTATQSRSASTAAAQIQPSAGRDCTPSGYGYAVFIGKDTLGEGARELGENLMKMAIYTLSQSEDVPAALLFMNSGVKLPAGEEAQVIDSLKELAEKGIEILVCGTCLNYYGLTEQLKVGTVSNMYDILEKMQQVSKVVTL